MARLRLSVAVADLEPGRLAPRLDDLRVERLARGDHPPQRGQLPQCRALGQRPVLGRRLAEHVDALALDELQPLVGLEAAVDDHRRRAAQPRRDEDVARRLRPARGGRAPDQLTGTGAEPVLGLRALSGQVALGVQGRAGLARRPGREDDQRRVAGGEVGDRGRRLLRAILVQGSADLGQGHVRDPVRQLAEQVLVADAECRACGRGAQREVLAAQLGVAGQRHRAHPPAGEHRQHPLQAVADQGHDDVAAVDAAGGERPREPGGHRDQLAEVPDAPPAVARDRDQRRRRRRKALEDVLGEVHWRQCSARGSASSPRRQRRLERARLSRGAGLDGQRRLVAGLGRELEHLALAGAEREAELRLAVACSCLDSGPSLNVKSSGNPSTTSVASPRTCLPRLELTATLIDRVASASCWLAVRSSSFGFGCGFGSSGFAKAPAAMASAAAAPRPPATIPSPHLMGPRVAMSGAAPRRQPRRNSVPS